MANKIIKYYIQHYDELILTTVRITKNYEDAEDVMQSVALALCKREKELDEMIEEGDKFNSGKTMNNNDLFNEKEGESPKQATEQNERLLKEVIGPNEIADIVSKWTGIPVQRLSQGEAERFRFPGPQSGKSEPHSGRVRCRLC